MSIPMGHLLPMWHLLFHFLVSRYVNPYTYGELILIFYRRVMPIPMGHLFNPYLRGAYFHSLVSRYRNIPSVTVFASRHWHASQCQKTDNCVKSEDFLNFEPFFLHLWRKMVQNWKSPHFLHNCQFSDIETCARTWRRKIATLGILRYRDTRNIAIPRR